MKRKQRIPHYVSIYLRYLHQHRGDKCSEIVKRFCMYSEQNIYHNASLPVGRKCYDKRKLNKGRPPMLSPRDEWHLYQ